MIRIVLAVWFKGHSIDIGTFSAWAGHAAEGLLGFYSPGYFADYPPGYIYVLWGIGKLRAWLELGWESKAFLTLLKLPAILADLATAWVFYRAAIGRLGGWWPLAIAAAYALNPAVIADSAVWGQVDGVFTLFVLLGVLWLERRPGASGAAFAVALLVKPQALIFGPVPLLWFADRLFRQRQGGALRELMAFAGAGTAAFTLGVLPFAAQDGPAWVIGKYASTLASYPYASLNACNFFALVGGNAVELSQNLLFLSFKTWGIVFLAAIVAFSAWIAWRRGAPSRFVYLAAFLPASVFVWSTKMHERYLFPALAMLLAFYLLSRDRRALWLLAGFSATLCANIVQVFELSLDKIYYIDGANPLLLATSAANVLLWVLLAWMGCRPASAR